MLDRYLPYLNTSVRQHSGMRSEAAPIRHPSTLKRSAPPPLSETSLRDSLYFAKTGLYRFCRDGSVPAMSLEPQIRRDMNCNFVTGFSCSVTYRKADVYGGMDYLMLSSWVAYASDRIMFGNKSGIVRRKIFSVSDRTFIQEHLIFFLYVDMGK